MKDKIQKLMDQIKRDFPNGCQGLDCVDCPLLTAKGEVPANLCKVIRATAHMYID